MAVLASGEPMGQQRYEREVLEAVRRLPDAGAQIEQVVVRSVRSSLHGNRRLPLSMTDDHPSLRRLAGCWSYRGADVVHRCDLRLPPASGPPEVLTVHDLAFRHFPDESAVSMSAVDEARRARIVLTPSQATADEVRELLGHADVRVAPNGVDRTFFDAPGLTDADRSVLGVGRHPYVIHGGGSTRRKNLSALAVAWEEVATALPDVQLVLAGPPHPRRAELFARLPRTHLVGLLPRRLQRAAVRSADAVAVPSTYEGFGFPVLEGMAAGVPVVAARRASLPEIAGDAALLVESDGPALATGLHSVLTDDALAARLRQAGPLRAAGFTWEASALVHLRAYRDALAAR